MWAIEGEGETLKRAKIGSLGKERLCCVVRRDGSIHCCLESVAMKTVSCSTVRKGNLLPPEDI